MAPAARTTSTEVRCRNPHAPAPLGAGGPQAAVGNTIRISADDQISCHAPPHDDRHTLAESANLTLAREPVTQKQYAKTLFGRVVRRPAFVSAAGFVLRLMLGEMYASTGVDGQRGSQNVQKAVTN